MTALSFVDNPAMHSLVLDNGLRVQLHHRPQLKQAAAWLRVAAGSHDVPRAWPGLAHFLEHLLFRGTERFDGDQALMPYVQRQGGQLNARTSERTTDYFFELPSECFAEGLERLCEMLACPRLDLPTQRQEREVLHAEFIAWTRAAETRQALWLSAPLNPAHPLRGFHAGNRYSLKVPNPAFQAALLSFRQRYYQAGQMQLCLAGPQPLHVLERLARDAGGLLPHGKAVLQEAPPALRVEHAGGDSGGAPDPYRLNLVFASEALGPGTRAACTLLASWLESPHPGGLLGTLRNRGWAHALRLECPYQFAGQGLVNLEVRLTDTGRSARGLVSAACLDWLQWLSGLDDWPKLRDTFARIEQRRSQVAGALEWVRRAIEAGQSPSTAQDLRELLAALHTRHLLHPLTPTDEPCPVGEWHKPPANPLLDEPTYPDQLYAGPSALEHYGRSVRSDAQSALRLRWQLSTSPDPDIGAVLEQALQPLIAQASQAGVEVRFNPAGNQWTLACHGIASALPAVVEQAVAALLQPDLPVALSAPAPAMAQIPIRELLKALPAFLDEHAVRPALPGTICSAAALREHWQGAHWDGLAVDLPALERNALNQALLAMPGQPMDCRPAAAPLLEGRQWKGIASTSAEAALLVFCPVTSHQALDQAAWRLLGQLCQGPFYQRLRVELQLGYAVFSDFRQIAGQGGLLFGVQSPTCSVEMLLNHVETFIARLPACIAALEETVIRQQAVQMAERFLPERLSPGQACEHLWQARLAGQSPNDLGNALKALDPPALLAAATRIAQRQAPRRWLANGDEPPATDIQ
jgi:coenzyme PQQ biosynthesis probable peptidase PqqF